MNLRNVFDLKKNHACSIGVDMSDDSLKLAQLGDNAASLSLIAGGSKNCPQYIELASVKWQRWAIEAIKEMTSNVKFQNKNVIATMPPADVFIDHIRMPAAENDIEQAVFSRIKQKLPFDCNGAVTKYIPTEEDNILVIAMEREKIDRHLAFLCDQ